MVASLRLSRHSSALNCCEDEGGSHTEHVGERLVLVDDLVDHPLDDIMTVLASLRLRRAVRRCFSDPSQFVRRLFRRLVVRERAILRVEAYEQLSEVGFASLGAQRSKVRAVTSCGITPREIDAAGQPAERKLLAFAKWSLLARHKRQ